jgi:hypothetical protein
MTLRTPEEIKEMIRMRKAGMSYAAIGHEYGLSRQRIHQILSRTHLGYKESVWKRASGRCEICGLPEHQHFRSLTYHHIHPIVKGYNNPENVLLVCESCHRELHTASPPEKLIRRLWEIKGPRTFKEMANKIDDLSEDGLWRIMRGTRNGRLSTWRKIIEAYPQLTSVSAE